MFRPTGRYVRTITRYFNNNASVYHIVAMRVIWTSWAHVWRLRSLFLGTGYDNGGGYLGHHESGSYYHSHDYPEPSLRAGTFASASYPDWYAPLERYVSYGIDQAEHVVEGIRGLERRMDDFFGHFGINPDA
jgi:hypothetical protein